MQILEKIYHSSENPTLLTTIPRTRELFWIKELGTAAKPYGFNDQIKGVGTLSSISCKKTNIYSLFNNQPRRKRSHGKRHYNKGAPQPDVTMSTLVDLVGMIEKPEGVHKINTKWFSISFLQLRHLQELALESTNFDSPAEYRVTAIILDIANHRLFRPVRSDVPAEKPKHFMKIKLLNKAVDAINLPALLRSTSVTDKIPDYFKDKEPPTVSYEYTSTVASKLFNFAPAFSHLNVSEYLSDPQTYQCNESKFCYEPHGHVITGDLRVIENAKLRELVAKGPKYIEPSRVNWKATETMFLESTDLHAKIGPKENKWNSNTSLNGKTS